MDFKPVVTISWELLFQIINTVILFLVLKKLLFKPVLNIIEKRENMIQDDLATGAKAKNEGIALKKEYEEIIFKDYIIIGSLVHTELDAIRKQLQNMINQHNVFTIDFAR